METTRVGGCRARGLYPQIYRSMSNPSLHTTAGLLDGPPVYKRERCRLCAVKTQQQIHPETFMFTKGRSRG
ncbi:unnamed protein product [Arctogadus glacialis]